MKNKVRIIIADDHPVLSEGLVSVLNKREGMEIIGLAIDGEEALNLIRKYKPDIAILDVQMPKPDGFEVAQIVISEKLPTKIIFLTMFKEEDFIKKAIDLGIKGYILKESAVIDIIKCIAAVENDKFFLSPQVSDVLLSYTNKKENEEELTSSEKKILLLIGKGKGSKEIAEELSVSIKTVENHRSHICKKLGITGNSALLKYSMQNNIS